MKFDQTCGVYVTVPESDVKQPEAYAGLCHDILGGENIHSYANDMSVQPGCQREEVFVDTIIPVERFFSGSEGIEILYPS